MGEVPMQVDRELDARGLNCPLPLMKAKKVLGEMKSGEVLRVVATDSGSMPDFLTFAKEAGHELLEQSNVGHEYIHVLRRR
jgi:TusA-related sulfurtransferase